jgi:hypothetical protein
LGVILSVAWLPASLALAGNLSSTSTVGPPLLVGVSALVAALLGVALVWAVCRLVLSTLRRTGVR